MRMLREKRLQYKKSYARVYMRATQPQYLQLSASCDFNCETCLSAKTQK